MTQLMWFSLQDLTSPVLGWLISQGGPYLLLPALLVWHERSAGKGNKNLNTSIALDREWPLITDKHTDLGLYSNISWLGAVRLTLWGRKINQWKSYQYLLYMHNLYPGISILVKWSSLLTGHELYAPRPWWLYCQTHVETLYWIWLWECSQTATQDRRDRFYYLDCWHRR